MSRRGVIALAMAALVVVAGCGASIGSPAATTSPRATQAGALPAGGSTAPAGSEGTGPTEPVAGSPGESPPPKGPPPTESPSSAETPAASAPEASPGTAVGAEACSGSAENRDFFLAAAESFSWDVYCPALPDGWFVETGTYRLADGGRLEIAFRGPDGARIELREGAYCTAGASACSPRDHEIGPAAFGDREGTLVTLGPSEADGFAVYVDPGAAPSWSFTGTGMSRAGFVALAAALLRVVP